MCFDIPVILPLPLPPLDAGVGRFHPDPYSPLVDHATQLDVFAGTGGSHSPCELSNHVTGPPSPPPDERCLHSRHAVSPPTLQPRSAAPLPELPLLASAPDRLTSRRSPGGNGSCDPHPRQRGRLPATPVAPEAGATKAARRSWRGLAQAECAILLISSVR